ncbi:alpha/beta fold hydrolase [Idiomarina xiamenensis]|uniref:Alpha/beta hydrolase n=1 Tax=Idiomarina xiamenensis 10-D-4 TaxID=740709 RepID=K2LAJ4_9GAMM|nr:alpha/beta fold hydrolase [Idiomarina xiamenensis]EKE86850.1 alpha/beta hydrolase [Idiomarina xiamenensis 10-D-4]
MSAAPTDSSPRLNYQLEGEFNQTKKPPIMLIHGLFGDLDNLKGISRELQDYPRILIDTRNHGDSFHSAEMDYPSMAADAFKVLQHLNLEQVIVIGHSMGGKIAMEMTMQQPQRILKAVFADVAPVAYEARHNHILDCLTGIDLAQVDSRQAAEKQMQAAIPERGVRQFLLKNLRRDKQGYHWRLNLPALQQNYDNIIGAVSEGHFDKPVLLIKGGQSDYLTSAHQDAVTARYSDAQVKVVEGAGHWLHAEKPRIVNRLIRQFIES